MKRRITFFLTVFLSYLIAQNTLAIHDLRVVKNKSVINLINAEIANLNEKAATIVDREVMFMVNLEKVNEVMISFIFFNDDINVNFLIKKMIAVIEIDDCKTFDEVIRFVTSENYNPNFEPKILKLKFSGTDNVSAVYSKLFYIKDNLGLKNYIDFEKDGRVYYTVPSEDKLDDVHIVYESGNERKEFKFTNLPEKPIVPVEETNKINQENIKPKKNFFSLPSFISKFFKKNYQEKNNNDFLNEEQKKLKVD